MLNEAGEVVAQDTQPDATPVSIYTPWAGTTYKVRATNADQRGRAAFVLFGVLQME